MSFSPFSPKVKVVIENGEVLAVMIRQRYIPRTGKNSLRAKNKKNHRYRWRMANYEVEIRN